MAHECRNCGQLCFCDPGDMWMEPWFMDNDCEHRCEPATVDQDETGTCGSAREPAHASAFCYIAESTLRHVWAFLHMLKQRVGPLGDDDRSEALALFCELDRAIAPAGEMTADVLMAMDGYLAAACVHAEAGLLPHADVVAAWRAALRGRPDETEGT